MRNHRMLVAASLSLALVPSAAMPQGSVTQAIRARTQQYVAAWNRGDAEGASTAYTMDGTHTYALGYTHRGRTEIANGLKDLLAGPMKGTQLAIETLNVRQLSDDVAVEEEAFAVSGLKSPDGTALPNVKGLCLAVYRKVREEWLGAAVQCMVPPPTPPS